MFNFHFDSKLKNIHAENIHSSNFFTESQMLQRSVQFKIKCEFQSYENFSCSIFRLQKHSLSSSIISSSDIFLKLAYSFNILKSTCQMIHALLELHSVSMFLENVCSIVIDAENERSLLCQLGFVSCFHSEMRNVIMIKNDSINMIRLSQLNNHVLELAEISEQDEAFFQ